VVSAENTNQQQIEECFKKRAQLGQLGTAHCSCWLLCSSRADSCPFVNLPEQAPRLLFGCRSLELGILP